MPTPITTLYTTIAHTKADFKIDWKETSKADWKVTWATGIEASGPKNTVSPVIAGSLVHGSVLTVTPGTWTGYPAPVITHQWRNDSGPIAGATGLTYTTQTSDVGKGIACTEIATNIEGIESVVSNILGPIT